MGRIKQKPRRSVGVFVSGSTITSGEKTAKANSSNDVEPKIDDDIVQDTPFLVDVDRSNWNLIEHRDISEIVVSNLKFSHEFFGFDLTDEFNLRIRLCNVDEHLGRIKLGHWPLLSSENVYLEIINKRLVDEIEVCDVIVCGQFDGSDEGVTGLAHLVSVKFLTLRPVLGVKLCEDVSSLRIRVEMLQGAFDACESVLDNNRPVWKKSMMSVMGWLRPELINSETRYGILSKMGVDLSSDSDRTGGIECSTFDVGRFYEAIKRSKHCPMLDVELPDLVPELRPYQSRAACWMVQREKVALQDSSLEWEHSLFHSPLCVAMNFLDSCSRMFYNPFR
ncbi:unnamed protein product [Amaranthus hypochondriacus]